MTEKNNFTAWDVRRDDLYDAERDMALATKWIRVYDADQVDQRMTQGVLLTLEQANLIRAVFMPRNPNKMRGAHPDVVAVAKEFIRLFDAAKQAERSRVMGVTS